MLENSRCKSRRVSQRQDKITVKFHFSFKIFTISLPANNSTLDVSSFPLLILNLPVCFSGRVSSRIPTLSPFLSIHFFLFTLPVCLNTHKRNKHPYTSSKRRTVQPYSRVKTTHKEYLLILNF